MLVPKSPTYRIPAKNSNKKTCPNKCGWNLEFERKQALDQSFQKNDLDTEKLLVEIVSKKQALKIIRILTFLTLLDPPPKRMMRNLQKKYK